MYSAESEACIRVAHHQGRISKNYSPVLGQVTMKILFLIPYPLKESPSQRFRFEQYFKILQAAGHSFETQSFLVGTDWKDFLMKGNALGKTLTLFRGLTRRFLLLTRIHRFDLVFIHREAAPVGPPIIEWVIAKVLSKKIVFDFDDAIWLPDQADEPRWKSVIKWRRKIRAICHWSYKVSCGNDYLYNYARQFNSRVVYNPSTIDTIEQHDPSLFRSHPDKAVIGWTGSHSTMKYLMELVPVLRELKIKYPHISILIISDRPPELPGVQFTFIPWSAETEIEMLTRIDIGIMPLPDDEWSKGKCGFKALQYMSLEKPAVVSPVGVNAKIIDHAINGFHCTTAEDWLHYLGYLIDQKDVCARMGKSGREKVINHYSVVSNTSNFLTLFE